ncbi:MAG TPA: energy transducer TonB [Pyrinomonadaceae bacterium]|nr:energy transducer TonB [Pyrinomonadaceae bacterium]
MFDKMIVSEAGDGKAGRSRYFLVSTFAVAAFFLAAVVFSLYAADIGLGREDFDLSVMIAPVAPEAPEPPRPETPEEQREVQHTERPSRVHNMLRPDEVPSIVPNAVSVNQNPYASRPPGRFDIGNHDSAPGLSVEGGSRRSGSEQGSGIGTSSQEPAVEPATIPAPPPPIVKKPEPPRSLGVITGKATSLPKPVYSPAALQVNAQGDVTVQVTIDETGNVISAKAVSGHPLLRRESERAAMNAKFSPTTLSKVPVKVTGMIVYTFRRN